jgi:hypothetical protein
VQRLLDIGGKDRRQKQRPDDIGASPAVIANQILNQIRHRQKATAARSAGHRGVDQHIDDAIFVVAKRIVGPRLAVEDALERADNAGAILLEVVVQAKPTLDANLPGARPLCIAKLIIRMHPLRDHAVFGQLLLAALALHIRATVKRRHQEAIGLWHVLLCPQIRFVGVDADRVNQVAEALPVGMTTQLSSDGVDNLGAGASKPNEDGWREAIGT